MAINNPASGSSDGASEETQSLVTDDRPGPDTSAEHSRSFKKRYLALGLFFVVVIALQIWILF